MLKKTLKVPESLKDITKLLSGNIATKIVGICVLGFYARVLSKQELAIIPIYAMLSDLASLVFSFGIMPNMIKQLPSLFKQDIPEAKRLIATSSFIIFSGTLLISTLVVLFCDQVNDFLLDGGFRLDLIRTMTLGFVALSISKIAEQILWAAGRFGKKSLLSFIESIIRPCCMVTLFIYFGVKGLVVGMVINQYIKAALACFFVKDLLPGISGGFYSPVSLLRQSIPFYLESFLMYFRREGDNWLLSTMLGPASLAVYYIAKTIYNSIYTIYSSIDQVVTKQLAYYKNDHAILLEKGRQIHNNISLVIIPGLLLTISLLPIIIPLLAGPSFQSAIWPSIFLLLALQVDFQRIVISRTIFTLFNPIIRFTITFFETLILLPGLFLFGSLFDASGIAVARVLGQMAGAGAGFWILSRKISFHIDIKPLFTIGMISFMSTLCTLLLQCFMQGLNLKLIVQLFAIPTAWIIVAACLLYLVSKASQRTIVNLLQVNYKISLLQRKQ